MTLDDRVVVGEPHRPADTGRVRVAGQERRRRDGAAAALAAAATAADRGAASFWRRDAVAAAPAAAVRRDAGAIEPAPAGVGRRHLFDDG